MVLASKQSPWRKELIVKRIVGGYCSSCGAIATHKALFNAHGATLVEKYCDNCVKEQKFSLKNK